MKPKLNIDSEQILEKLSLEEDREKVSLYLSKGIYERFKKGCKSASASRVMEELMKLFLEDLKKRRMN